MDKAVCIECRREFSSKDALFQHTQAKHSEKIKRSKLITKQKRKIKNWLIFTIIAILVISGTYFLVSNIKTLPPTDIQGHAESSPESHILKEPMPLAVQKHMLEHADGKGPPGVIINYNCDDYICEDGLIKKLEAFAEKYYHVYVAPFPKMDAKIALTKYGKIKIPDSYNEERIKGFILGK